MEWPTVTRRANERLVAAQQAREQHDKLLAAVKSGELPICYSRVAGLFEIIGVPGYYEFSGDGIKAYSSVIKKIVHLKEVSVEVAADMLIREGEELVCWQQRRDEVNRRGIDVY